MMKPVDMQRLYCCWTCILLIAMYTINECVATANVFDSMHKTMDHSESGMSANRQFASSLIHDELQQAATILLNNEHEHKDRNLRGEWTVCQGLQEILGLLDSDEQQDSVNNNQNNHNEDTFQFQFSSKLERLETISKSEDGANLEEEQQEQRQQEHFSQEPNTCKCDGNWKDGLWVDCSYVNVCVTQDRNQPMIAQKNHHQQQQQQEQDTLCGSMNMKFRYDAKDEWLVGGVCVSFEDDSYQETCMALEFSIYPEFDTTVVEDCAVTYGGDVCGCSVRSDCMRIDCSDHDPFAVTNQCQDLELDASSSTSLSAASNNNNQESHLDPEIFLPRFQTRKDTIHLDIPQKHAEDAADDQDDVDQIIVTSGGGLLSTTQLKLLGTMPNFFWSVAIVTFTTFFVAFV